MLAAVALAAAPVRAQSYFPTDPPTLLMSDDFSGDLSAWTVVEDPNGWGASWTVTSAGTPSDAGTYWAQHLLEDAATSSQRTALLANATAVGYSSLQLEFELSPGSYSTNLGAVWDVNLLSGSAYIFSFNSFPSTDPGSDAGQPHALWTIVKRVGGVDQIVGSAPVTLYGSHGTMIQGGVYRIRVSAYCGNLRVEAQRVTTSGDSVLYSGGCPGSPLTTPECWDTVVEWTDPAPLGAGEAGLYSSSTDSDAAQALFDNAEISFWQFDCAAGCTNWTEWNELWPTGDQTARDELQFKLDYEGVLQDFVNTNDNDPTNWGRMDCEASVDDTCDGMRMLVDMPAPDLISTTADRAAQDDKIVGYLKPVASVVDFLPDVPMFDNSFNDPLRPGYVATDPYKPIPIVSSGDTPIANAMMDAYNWYVDLRTGDGAWTQDSLAVCRKWYVVLITDGEEHCDGDVCGTGQAADLFADVANSKIVPPVQVSTIGFTLSGDDSPLKCLSERTGGTYASAADANSLADQLNAILNQYQAEDRSFASVSVSPQLSTSLTSSDTSYLLTVPVFKPQNDKSIWQGHLHTYLLDASHLSPPVDADGNLDPTSPYWQWDAGEALETQLHGGSPFRNLYWPSDVSSSWERVSLADVKTNPTRKAEFRALTADPRITDAVADSVVDFTYFFNDTDRPDEYTALGDIYHSRPVIVGAPKNFKYLLRNLNDYATYSTTYEHRRRVVFAGGNDGLLHAFDIGQYVSDAYETGTGKELFGVMPQSVMPNLYAMAAQPGAREQQYMVDGQISSADVHIDIAYTGDPGDSDPGSRTWRTIVLSTMRAGGRSVLALDVTQPDKATPSGDLPPDCLDAGVGCPQPYPRVMWEFTDRTDADVGCSAADAAAGICDPADYWDLGDTWSKPLIARVRKATDDEMFVAFFGGGNDPEGDDTTGNFLYGVDIETGQIIFKANVGASIPGGIAGLDKDDDGFVDVIYFGTTNGYIYKLDLTAEAVLADDAGAVPPGKRVSNWAVESMYSFGADIKFYMTPVLVPVKFDVGGYLFAVALGAGDRDNIDLITSDPGRFYFVLDNNDTGSAPHTQDDLQGVAFDADPAVAGTDYFKPTDPTDPTWGWYLILRDGEKVSTDALVTGQTVVFPTFERTEMSTDPTVDTDGDGVPDLVVCQASGIGRIYKVDYLNANPIGDTRGTDTDLGLITGIVTTGSGGASGSEITGIGQGTKIEVFSVPNTTGARVTNWRQE